jgi:hypothetical protein
METEEELWDRIRDATGVELVADINSGLQGTVYMVEEAGLVAKITNSPLEAATAVTLMENPDSFMPLVKSVHRFRYEGRDKFLILREDLDDLVDVFDDGDEEVDRDYRNVFINVKHPAFVSDEITASKAKCLADDPDIFDRFAAVLKGVADFNELYGVEVSDIHFGNLGKRSDGQIVLRDFGMSSMSEKLFEELSGRIESIPDQGQSFRPW